MRRIVLLLGLLLPLGAQAAQGPRPPCGAAPEPPYAAVGTAPNLRVAHVDGWEPPACAGWSSPGSTLLVALSGSFRFPGTADDLLARFGAVSTLRGIKYWSAGDRRWRTFITEASALTAADPARQRPDFSAAELRSGGDVYFVQRDSRSSAAVVYRMRVLRSGPQQVVVTVANVSPIRMFLMTLFDPGDVQTTYFLNRLATGVWGYYGLWGARTGLLTRGHDSSSINRAVAVYRHFAGIPTDQEPPAAR